MIQNKIFYRQECPSVETFNFEFIEKPKIGLLAHEILFQGY